jgi:predicted lipid-binding transport protein (Tim44 family)
LITKSYDFVDNTVFAPNEEGRIKGEFKERDKNFTMERFLNQVEHHVIPTVLNAYFKDNKEVLEDYLAKPFYRQVLGNIKEREFAKTVNDSKLLGISELSLARVYYENGEPTILVTSMIDYLSCIKDLKGEIVSGSSSSITRESFFWAFQMNPEKDSNDWEVVTFTTPFANLG